MTFTLPEERRLWIPDIDEAVEGRLPVFGGWGNAAILIVLRSDLSGLLGVRPADIDLEELRLEAELDSAVLLNDGLGLGEARILEEIWDGEGALAWSDETGKLFLDFGAESGGKDPVEGFAAGRDGWGNVDMEEQISHKYSNR